MKPQNLSFNASCCLGKRPSQKKRPIQKNLPDTRDHNSLLADFQLDELGIRRGFGSVGKRL